MIIVLIVVFALISQNSLRKKLHQTKPERMESIVMIKHNVC